MGQGLLIILSVVAGLVLGALSNWLYDLLKGAGIFPDRPRLKHILVIVLGALPLIVLVALPELNNLAQAQRTGIEGASVRILRVIPNPQKYQYQPRRSNSSITVLADYDLPDAHIPTTLQLAYSAAYSPESGYQWWIISSTPMEPGKHGIELTGQFTPPDKAVLSGKPLLIGLFVTDMFVQDLLPDVIFASDTAELGLSGD